MALLKWSIGPLTTLTLLVTLAGCFLARSADPGASLVRRKCSRCHTTPTQTKLRSMSFERILQIHPKVRLTGDEQRTLRSYVAKQ